jgi:hypothetical protein
MIPTTQDPDKFESQSEDESQGLKYKVSCDLVPLRCRTLISVAHERN